MNYTILRNLIKYAQNEWLDLKFFELYNTQKLLKQKHSIGMYYRNYISKNISPSECIKCNNFIDYCPQHINIPRNLEKVLNEFE